MVRSHAQVVVCAFMVGILIGVSTTLASAATISSPWGYYGPFLGYSYKNQATVSNDGHLYAYSRAENQQSENIPTGYMGALAVLYKSDVVCESTGWAYNSGPAVAFYKYTVGPGCGSGIYYSKGLTSAYNGDGYSEYYTFQSPSINNYGWTKCE